MTLKFKPARAFPTGQEDSPGMDLRDYFAAKALQGILANPGTGRSDSWLDATPAWVAEYAYKYADAMLIARKAGFKPASF